MKEIWKKIREYNDYYVSNLGRVKSFKKNKEKILKPGLSLSGYLQVILCQDDIKKCCLVHRLVANEFLVNKNNLKEINHIDENKKNNCVDNLEWCDHKYNMNYGTIKTKQEVAKNKKVAKYDKKGNLLQVYKSIKEASLKNNIGSSNITNCCKHAKHYNTCKGFKWEYV